MARTTHYNNITSPELLSKVNPKNNELLNDFIDYLISIQRSETTIYVYKNDIQIAWVWCLKENNNLFFCNWTKKHIVKYQTWLLNDNKNSPSRIRRLKAALSSLSNYIETVLDEEFPYFKNIVKRIENPVLQPIRDKTILTEKQLNKLLRILTEKGKYEKACALALAICSGRRKSELLRFKISDFNKDRLICDGGLYKSHPIKTKGRGANGKYLECFCIVKDFNPYLKKWIKYRKENNINSEWLFPSKSDCNKPIPATTIDSWAKTFSKILGTDFYWHAVRHMTVTKFKRAGIPDTVIQQYIGWKDISMISIYSDVSKDEQLSMYFGKTGIVTTK